MTPIFFAALVMGGATFCFILFFTDDKPWDKEDREYAAIKYGALMFLFVAALAGLGML